MKAPLYAVPSPVSAITADYLLARIRADGGRAYRMLDERAYVLTDNEELAEWLLGIGGTPYGQNAIGLKKGAYRRERGGKVEYDVWISTIPVSGPSVWEALAP